MIHIDDIEARPACKIHGTPLVDGDCFDCVFEKEVAAITRAHRAIAGLDCSPVHIRIEPEPSWREVIYALAGAFAAGVLVWWVIQ